MSQPQGQPLTEAVQRVSSFLQQAGHSHAPVMLADAARTAQQAADALGVQLGQIAKSIVFKRLSDNRAVLVITSGDLRVDEQKVSQLVALAGVKDSGAPTGANGLDAASNPGGPLGQVLGRANADFVKAQTGFSIGGVAPVAHREPCVVLLDQALFRFPVIWAAAGHPHAVFQISPAQLQALSGAPVADVTEKQVLEQATP
jgi:prolyl-tRNA editing enzyme YbaK/EbsC (Cys-tRNA(Pro) deacylase)